MEEPPRNFQHNANAVEQSLQRCLHPAPIPPWTIHPRELGNPTQPLGDLMIVVSRRDLEQSDKLIEEAVRHVSKLLHTQPGSARHTRAQQSARRWLQQFL